MKNAISLARILLHYIQAKHFGPRTRADLERLQTRKLRRLLERAARDYDFHAGKAPLSLEACAPIQKSEYRERFHELNRHRIRLDDAIRSALAHEAGLDDRHESGPLGHQVTAGLSTGTSGLRGVFLTTASERARWAGTILARCLPGSIFRKTKIALCLRANNDLYRSIGRSRRLQFRYFSLEQSPEDLARELIAYQPDVLLAPPAVLARIAQHTHELRPARLVSVADVLDRSDVATFESCFGQKVHQIYQATEGFLGATCEHGTLHLNEDVMIFEREHLDARRFYPILTDLHRTSQLMLRYRLDDILVLRPQPCPCGSPLLAIERIEGRAKEFFVVPGAESPIYREDLMRPLEAFLPNHMSYRLVQVDGLRFRLKAQDEIPQEAIARAVRGLEALFASRTPLAVEITIERGFRQALHEKRGRISREFEPAIAPQAAAEIPAATL